MLKFLIFLVLVAGSSIFVTEAFSLEIELQQEHERIIESLGWLEPEKMSFQEQIQVIVDHTNKQKRISVGLLSNNPNDIRFPDNLEAIVDDPRIVSFSITNKFACAHTETDRGCIIVEVDREGLGDNVADIRENTRKITDELVGIGVIAFEPEFYSVKIEGKTSFSGEKTKVVTQAIYTINKQSTSNLWTALSTMLLSSDIRTSNGFYNIAETLSENYYSDFTVKMIPLENGILRSMQISLVCSSIIAELPSCPDYSDDKIPDTINPLEFIETESVNRSSMFDVQFLPLNSIVHVLIFSNDDLQVKSVNSNIIENLRDLGDLQESGWFFSSESGKKIDARYLFGKELSVSKNDLVFSIGPNTGDAIEIKEGGGCLIATAAFGSEMSPQVQFLREIRDNTVLQTESGALFMTGFNQFYYSFSPAVADYERENAIFKEAVKLTLTPLLTSMTLLQYAEIDSESEMLGYGISIILLNIGMYFVAPAILIMTVRKRFN